MHEHAQACSYLRDTLLLRLGKVFVQLSHVLFPFRRLLPVLWKFKIVFYRVRTDHFPHFSGPLGSISTPKLKLDPRSRSLFLIVVRVLFRRLSLLVELGVVKKKSSELVVFVLLLVSSLPLFFFLLSRSLAIQSGGGQLLLRERQKEGGAPNLRDGRIDAACRPGRFQTESRHGTEGCSAFRSLFLRLSPLPTIVALRQIQNINQSLGA